MVNIFGIAVNMLLNSSFFLDQGNMNVNDKSAVLELKKASDSIKEALVEANKLIKSETLNQ